MRTVNCQGCGRSMAFLKLEKIQLGQTGAFLGDWPNILAGALEVEIYCCPKCGKIELYRPEEYLASEPEEPAFDTDDLPPESEQRIIGVSREGIPQIRCPACGATHDFDYPRCPKCEFEY